jgi:hypothetical protein
MLLTNSTELHSWSKHCWVLSPILNIYIISLIHTHIHTHVYEVVIKCLENLSLFPKCLLPHKDAGAFCVYVGWKHQREAMTLTPPKLGNPVLMWAEVSCESMSLASMDSAKNRSKHSKKYKYVFYSIQMDLFPYDYFLSDITIGKCFHGIRESKESRWFSAYHRI